VGLKDLPDASGDRHAKAFARLGWERQPKRGKGSHIVLIKHGRPLSIPNHRSVKRTVLATLIKRAGVSEADYLDAFR
jgi:hypothetical protein